MKRMTDKCTIGIATMYYGSHNYGGLLQAYALCQALNDRGYDAKQICYSEMKQVNTSIREKMKELPVELLSKEKYKKCKSFAESIPHTHVYNSNSIYEAGNEFDVYIVGSDQVWNPKWVNDFYFLKFTNEKKKISYAASVGVDSIPEDSVEMYRQALSSFTSISVREQAIVPQLSSILNKEIFQTVDPTLLLTPEEWEKVSEPCIIKGKYVFCYFLGDEKTTRDIVTKFAEEKSLKIVSLPFSSGKINFTDPFFKGIKRFNISPGEFISLIKNADYVFTDSFHASVFSLLFQKKFIVFERQKNDIMMSRIGSLLDLFDCKYRLYSGQGNYMDCLEKEISQDQTRFLASKAKSLEFLNNSLNS